MLKDHNDHYYAIDLGQGFVVLVPKVEPLASIYLYTQSNKKGEKLWYQLYWYRDGKFNKSNARRKIPAHIFTAYQMYCLKDRMRLHG